MMPLNFHNWKIFADIPLPWKNCHMSHINAYFGKTPKLTLLRDKTTEGFFGTSNFLFFTNSLDMTFTWENFSKFFKLPFYHSKKFLKNCSNLWYFILAKFWLWGSLERKFYPSKKFWSLFSTWKVYKLLMQLQQVLLDGKQFSFLSWGQRKRQTMRRTGASSLSPWEDIRNL